MEITGQNIILDADKNIEINAGGDFRVVANNTVNMVSTNMYLTAPYGKIRVREVSGWEECSQVQRYLKVSGVHNVRYFQRW